jgi:tRNA_anti-like
MKRLYILGYWLACTFCFAACNTAKSTTPPTPPEGFHYNYDTENGTGVRELDTPTPASTVAHQSLPRGAACTGSSECIGLLACSGGVCLCPNGYTDVGSTDCMLDTHPTPTRDTTPTKKIPLRTIVSEYRNNEVRADNKYKGQTIRFTGTVSSVSKDFLGKEHLWLNDHDAYADFDNTNLSNLNVGDEVVLTCECKGKGLMSVRFEHCQ